MPAMTFGFASFCSEVVSCMSPSWRFRFPGLSVSVQTAPRAREEEVGFATESL